MVAYDSIVVQLAQSESSAIRFLADGSSGCVVVDTFRTAGHDAEAVADEGDQLSDAAAIDRRMRTSGDPAGPRTPAKTFMRKISILIVRVSRAVFPVSFVFQGYEAFPL